MKKPVEDYLALNYRASVYRDEDGDFIIEVDDLPGCVTHGTTVSEAFENLEEAKKAWMESRLGAGLEIPKPKERSEYSGKILLRMPRSLHRSLAEQAEHEDVSLNQYVVSLVSMASVARIATVVNAPLAVLNVASYHVAWQERPPSGGVIWAWEPHQIATTTTSYQQSVEYRSHRLATAQNEPRMLTSGAA